MNLKVLKAALASLVLSLSGLANATLIVGDLYSDGSVQWEYVGSFDLADGPDYFNGATPYNGIEAAIVNFGSLSTGIYALSSMGADDVNFLVNHMAWYDSYDWTTGIHEASESATANNAGGALYDDIGDISAFVYDRAPKGENINHVFKSEATSVPEPSTLAIFALGIMGLASRRIKKQ